MRRTALPLHLAEDPFLVRDAVAHGVSPDRLRGRDLASVWGVRAARAHKLPESAFHRRCRMFALRMPPAAVFSHSTAARLLGAPLPMAVESATDLHIALPAPRRAPHARGIRGHRLTLAPHDIRTTGGLRHTSPARTWCDLATELRLLDLVAVGDSLLHGAHPLATFDELACGVASFAGRRGYSLLMEALPLLDGRAESRPESHLRVIFVRAGLPPDRINHTIVMTNGGADARIDLHFDEANVHVEYQGDYHRTREQWRKDMTRRTRLEARGGHVLEVNADDLKNPEELVRRVRMLLRRRLGQKP